MSRLHFRTPSRHRFVVGFVAAIVAAVGAAAFPSGAAAVDNHGFPRTFHVWSCNDAEKLAKFDMAVGFAYCDIARMRSLNPNGIFLMQPGLDLGTTSYNNVHSTYGGQQKWKGGTDTIVDGAAANLGTIRAFDPYWDYLINADGTIAKVNTSYNTYGHNLADPKAKGSATLIAKLIAYAAKQRKLYRNGWDGIYTDNWTYGNIGASWYYGPNLDTDRNGVKDDLTTLRRNFDTGLTNVGNLLRTYLPGKIVGANGNHFGGDAYYGTEANGWLKSSNYTQIEHIQKAFKNSPAGLITKVRTWLDYPDPRGMNRYVSTVQNGMTCTWHDLIIPSPIDPDQNVYMLDPCVMKSMRWGVTIAALTDAYHAVYPYNRHGANWWYDEFDGGVGLRKRGYLGLALGDPQKLANGVYRRDFQNGIVLNNSTAATQTVALGATYKKLLGTQNPSLNNGASVTSVSIAEHDGIILLRNGTPVTVVKPASTALPVLSGTAKQGLSLATSTGTWSGTAPFGFSYQWRRCDSAGGACVDIAGAAASSYLLAAADVGKTIRAFVTASNSAGSASAQSAQSAVVVAGTTTTTFQVSSQSPLNGQTVSGAVEWAAVIANGTASKVEFSIDGVLKWTEGIAPWVFNGDGNKWDTTTVTNGTHTLSLKATSTTGAIATSSITVTVSNGAPPPPAFAVAIAAPLAGATLKGSVQWQATTSGATVARVEFLIDNVLKWTEKTAPYLYNMTGILNTATLTNGSHTLLARAVATDGRVATKSITVTVAN